MNKIKLVKREEEEERLRMINITPLLMIKYKSGNISYRTKKIYLRKIRKY